MEKQKFTITELNEHLNSHDKEFCQKVYQKLAQKILSGKLDIGYNDFFFMEDHNNCYNDAPEGKITVRLEELLQAMLKDKYVVTNANTLTNFISFTTCCNNHNLIGEYFYKIMDTTANTAYSTLLANKLIEFPTLDAKLETRIYTLALLKGLYALAAVRRENINLKENFSHILDTFADSHNESVFFCSYYEITHLIAHSQGPANFCASINYLNKCRDFFASEQKVAKLFDAALQNYAQCSDELYPGQTASLIAFCNNRFIDAGSKCRLWKTLFETDKLIQLDNEEIQQALECFYLQAVSAESFQQFCDCLSKHLHLSTLKIEKTRYQELSTILGPKVELALLLIDKKVEGSADLNESYSKLDTDEKQKLQTCMNFLTSLAKEYGSFIRCREDSSIFHLLVEFSVIGRSSENAEDREFSKMCFNLAEAVCENSSSYDLPFLTLIKNCYGNCLEKFHYMKLNWLAFFRFMSTLAKDKNGIEAKIMKDIIKQLADKERSNFCEIDHILAEMAFDLDELPQNLQQRIDKIREEKKKQQDFLSRFT